MNKTELYKNIRQILVDNVSAPVESIFNWGTPRNQVTMENLLRSTANVLFDTHFCSQSIFTLRLTVSGVKGFNRDKLVEEVRTALSNSQINIVDYEEFDDDLEINGNFYYRTILTVSIR